MRTDHLDEENEARQWRQEERRRAASREAACFDQEHWHVTGELRRRDFLQTNNNKPMSENTQATAGGSALQDVDEQAAEKLANEAGSGGAAAQMAAAAGHAGDGQLTTQSDEWERLAAEMPNRDLHVPLVDPMFDTGKRFVVATLERPELVAADGEGKGSAARLAFKLEEELTSTDGIKWSPGYICRPRPYVLEPADANGRQKADIARRDLGNLLVSAGLATKAEALILGQITARLGKLTGRKVGVRFATKKGGAGAKRDPATGQPYVNQNLFFVSLEAAKASAQGNGSVEEGAGVEGEVPAY